MFLIHRFKSLDFNYVSGAKSCIELIAVHAANQEEQLEQLSYIRCFKRFIKYVRNFDQLNIIFNDQFTKKQRKVVDKDRPRVIDPVNPYNNFASEWNPKSIELVKYHANETKRRLDLHGGHGLIDLRQLFAPQSIDSGIILPDLNICKDVSNIQITHCGWVWKL